MPRASAVAHAMSRKKIIQIRRFRLVLKLLQSGAASTLSTECTLANDTPLLC